MNTYTIPTEPTITASGFIPGFSTNTTAHLLQMIAPIAIPIIPSFPAFVGEAFNATTYYGGQALSYLSNKVISIGSFVENPNVASTVHSTRDFIFNKERQNLNTDFFIVLLFFMFLWQWLQRRSSEQRLMMEIHEMETHIADKEYDTENATSEIGDKDDIGDENASEECRLYDETFDDIFERLSKLEEDNETYTNLQEDTETRLSYFEGKIKWVEEQIDGCKAEINNIRTSVTECFDSTDSSSDRINHIFTELYSQKASINSNKAFSIKLSALIDNYTKDVQELRNVIINSAINTNGKSRRE
jgi:hypothetical protein